MLFLVPDIGGFTTFVTETEVSHSQHIIKEFLELLVDANQLGLEVSEFQGDAVLTLEDYVRINILLGLMFKPLMRKKLESFVRASLDNIAVSFERSGTEVQR